MLGRRAFGFWKASERARAGEGGESPTTAPLGAPTSPPCGPARGPVADATELPDGPSPAARVPAHRTRGAAAHSSPPIPRPQETPDDLRAGNPPRRTDRARCTPQVARRAARTATPPAHPL